MFDRFRQPYPLNCDHRRGFLTALLIGSFIFLFLRLFQPFGLSNFEADNKTLILSGYGFITFALIFINDRLFPLLFPNWYKAKDWTVGRQIINTTWYFFSIGIGNLLYSSYFGFIRLNWEGLLFYQAITLLVGLFPVSLLTLIRYNQKLKAAVAAADGLNEQMALQHKEEHPKEKVVLPSKNKSESLSLPIDRLLFIKSQENYVEVYFLAEPLVEKQLIRNSQRDIQEALSNFPQIEKCHRSYLVNLDQIETFQGNAQGLTLSIPGVEDKVPVSRKFVPVIRHKLQKTQP